MSLVVVVVDWMLVEAQLPTVTARYDELDGVSKVWWFWLLLLLFQGALLLSSKVQISGEFVCVCVCWLRRKTDRQTDSQVVSLVSESGWR